MAALSLLQNRKPSVSAQRVAARRAAHQILDSPLVFDDPLAISILGPEFDQASIRTQKDNLESRALRAFMSVRSRYAEDKLSEAVDRNVRQYVVLGAGLDTYAYRCGKNDGQFAIYEVDQPSTQEWKRERLISCGIVAPSGLKFVPIDFESGELSACLAEHGFDREAPAFFSWLGVTPYLSREAFEETISFIASMPPSSGVVFDYAVTRESLSRFEQLVLDNFSERMNEMGEPFKLFLDPPSLASDLRKRGFETIEDLGTPEINERYFRNRVDKVEVFGGFAHLITALL